MGRPRNPNKLSSAEYSRVSRAVLYAAGLCIRKCGNARRPDRGECQACAIKAWVRDALVHAANPKKLGPRLRPLPEWLLLDEEDRERCAAKNWKIDASGYATSALNGKNIQMIYLRHPSFFWARGRLRGEPWQAWAGGSGQAGEADGECRKSIRSTRFASVAIKQWAGNFGAGAPIQSALFLAGLREKKKSLASLADSAGPMQCQALRFGPIERDYTPRKAENFLTQGAPLGSRQFH
jgi:hypothetical protein